MEESEASCTSSFASLRLENSYGQPPLNRLKCVHFWNFLPEINFIFNLVFELHVLSPFSGLVSSFLYSTSNFQVTSLPLQGPPLLFLHSIDCKQANLWRKLLSYTHLMSCIHTWKTCIVQHCTAKLLHSEIRKTNGKLETGFLFNPYKCFSYKKTRL